MLRDMTRYAIAFAFALFSAPAFAETYAIDKDAWTCTVPGAIEEAERLAKLANENEKAGVLYDRSKFEALEKLCMFGFRVSGNQIINNPVNVMYVKGGFAYVCTRETPCVDKFRDVPFFSCSYARVADLRDSRGLPVSQAQLEKEAAGKTMTDVKEFFPSACNAN